MQQVEIERVNEEIRAELEYSAQLDPISHPILDFEEDLDADAEILGEVTAAMEQQQKSVSVGMPNVVSTNKHINACIQIP